MASSPGELPVHLFDLGHQGEVDTTLIRKMLRMTPTERIRHHEGWRSVLRGGKTVPSFIEDMINLLIREQVEFVVVGMMSAVLQGSSLTTRDLDLCDRRTPANIARLVAALAPLHPRPRGFPEGLPFVFDERTVQFGANFTLEIGVESLDLLGEMSGLGGYENIIDRAVEVPCGSGRVRVLALEDLIRTKTAAGRTKDLAVLPDLQALLTNKQQGNAASQPPAADEKT